MFYLHDSTSSTFDCKLGEHVSQSNCFFDAGYTLRAQKFNRNIRTQKYSERIFSGCLRCGLLLMKSLSLVCFILGRIVSSILQLVASHSDNYDWRADGCLWHASMNTSTLKTNLPRSSSSAALASSKEFVVIVRIQPLVYLRMRPISTCIFMTWC